MNTLPFRRYVSWAAIATIVLIVGAGIGYWAGYRTVSADSAPANGRTVLYWHDPMVPNARFDKPGKSPFMDMQLVPVFSDSGGGTEKGVSVPASVAQSLGIRVGKVEKVALQSTLQATGSVVFDDRLLEVVQARAEGYVIRLHVKAPLVLVRRGEPLAEVQVPTWLEAGQEYVALLESESSRAASLREAGRERLRVLGMSEAEIRQIDVSHKVRASSTIVAPIDGTVSELGVREGGAFAAGSPLFRINGLASVWVNAQIPEAQAGLLLKRSRVTARATAWPGRTFDGQLLALLPDVDTQTRTVVARLSLRNDDNALVPGMYVAVTFNAPASTPQLVVPSEAVIMTGERNVVIRTNDQGSFDVVNVLVGSEQDGRTVILKGLSEGDSIVLSGQFLIDSEASLKSAVTRLEAETPPTGTPYNSPGHEADPVATHLGVGRVTALTMKQVTLAHEPVPSLDWPAMTMVFAAPLSGMPTNLKVGQRVSFSFSADPDGGYRVEQIVPYEEAVTPESRP